ARGASASTRPTRAWSSSPSRRRDAPAYCGVFAAQPASERISTAAITGRAPMGWVEYAPFGRLDLVRGWLGLAGGGAALGMAAGAAWGLLAVHRNGDWRNGTLWLGW